MNTFDKNRQYYKFCLYGFLKNLRFFDAFFILFLIENGLPYTQIGILYAIREIVINVFEIPSGIIADTFGRKNALVSSFVIYILSFYVFYISNEFWFFALAFVLYGFADAFRSGTHQGMIMDYLKLNDWSQQKISYYGHTRSWSQKGSAISSLVAGVLVFYSGSYQNIFLYSIFPYALNFLLILSYPQYLNKSAHKISSKKKERLSVTLKSFFQIIKQKEVLSIINTSALHSAYLKAIKDYIQPLMVNLALLVPFMLDVEIEKKNGIVVGVLYFLIYLLSSSASKYSSKFVGSKKFNVSKITLLLGFAFGLLSGLFFYYDMWIGAFISFVAVYFIENIRKPILTGFVADHVPNEIFTSVISVQALLKTLFTAIMAIVVGILADYFGIGLSMFLLSLVLIGFTLLLNLIRIKSKDN